DKIAKLLNIKSRKIPSLSNGEIDYHQLVKRIKKDKQNNPIIFANIGTTMRGATDDIKRIQHDIAAIGLERENYYIHADAALSGM
ncbi:pyridoxal-dependent decarboxylase, partial [Vibrio sp. OPT46]